MLRRQKGQSMVEFALISPVLVLIILAIIEMALIFQGYLTVQHAAREAARWAVTYQPEKGLDINGNPCCMGETDAQYWTRRVQLIKLTAREKAVGLRIDDAKLGLTGGPGLGGTFDAYKDDPNFYGVEVWGFPSFEAPGGGWTDADLRDHPGLEGLPVRVRVTHNIELLDPIFGAIVPRVRVVAQAEMINEGTQVGYSSQAPPALPPSPPLPSPSWIPDPDETPEPPGVTSTPIGTVETPTPHPTSTPTQTPTPTATPTGPFITSSDYVVIPTQLILIDVNQHPANTYELRWVDASFALVEVISPTLQVDGSGFRYNIEFTVPDDNQGTYYVETRLGGGVIARSASIEVVPPPPDLVVRSIGFPDQVLPNQEITVTVEVENQTASIVSGQFDVDLYVDPAAPPVTNRPGTSKLWLTGIGPNQTQVVTHVVVLVGGGTHQLWAQVDTSDWVPELDESNNILGPVGVTAASSECSELSDRFYGPDLDPKWSDAMIGNATVHEMVIDADEETLSITANGTSLWNRPDGGATLLYQEFTGDFVATLRVVQGMVSQGGSTQQWSKIGLTARASTAADSRWVMVMKSRDAIQFGYRTGSSGQRFASDVAQGAPVWVRLVRSGDSFSGYYSTDGSTWIAGTGDGENGGVTVDMPDTIVIGIAAASYSSTPAMGIVDDFEVCPLSADAETCQAYSDDFDDGVITGWTDADIGSTAPGSSNEDSGTGTIFISGNGSGLDGSSDSFHYTYKQVTGNFVATVKIESAPTSTSSDARAGLMVRNSTAPESAFISAARRPNNSVRFQYRALAGDTTNTNTRYDLGNDIWVRIVRNGTAMSVFYATDAAGQDWTYYYSREVFFSEDTVLIGLLVSSYSPGNLDEGEFDDFIFCAGDAGSIEPPFPPPAEEKPPGLKECVQVIEYGGFELSALLLDDYWTRNADVQHAHGRRHTGNFSFAFRASVSPPPEYRHLKPWAYQTVAVPGDVVTATESTLSFWQYVVPDPESSPTDDPDDHFYLAIRDSNGVTHTANIPLAHGDTDTPIFQQNVISVENYMAGGRLAEFAGEQMQVYFYGVHDGQQPGTYFYMDDVRLDICTTEPIPDEIPGTASIGGLVEVLLAGVPTKMPGISVWAFAAGGQLYSTRTIHDSTYHFYNVPPGTYTIYAEVQVGSYLYTGTVEVTVGTDERNYGVDLLLQ